jgi:hypothetical protein
MDKFTQWVSAELAELEAPMNDGGLWSCYLSDKVRILRAAVQHGDELLYDVEMASLDGDAYRWEELTLAIKQRDSIITEAQGVL